GCRVPGGAKDWRSYWDFLVAGRLGISEMPDDRWNKDLFYSTEPGRRSRTLTKWGGFVHDIAEFDAAFFGISPREAESMDPQQRVLLHVAWEALEDAGIPADRLAGSRTAVFVGASINDYTQVQRLRHGAVDSHAGTGNALSIVANRLSHRFDLRGPSVVVDTACSSSLVATDLAVSAILNDGCDLALACGVNALFDPAPFINFSAANMMSPRGRCHTFDASADGYVRAEGAGVVVLKRLSRALADGDRIHAVIRGTAVNQDGHTSTITVPSAEAQAAMLRLALSRAGLDPRDVGYVEAHGTGTPVGDPIESYAIGTTFGQPRLDIGGVVIGAGKTQIGHGESCAGILGLIKTALCLKHHAIPANLNFATPNPYIDFDGLGIDLPLKVRDWDARKGLLSAAVNSFGFGGTNASAVLSEAPRRPMPLRERSEGLRARAPVPTEPARPLVLLSAATQTALKTVAGRTAQHLENEPELDALDLANALATQRSRLPQSAVFDAPGREGLLQALKQYAETGAVGDEAGGVRVTTGKDLGNRKPVFLFSGQGGQWFAMGRELMASDPVYRGAIEEFDRHFRKASRWSVIEALAADEASSQIDHTHVTQPAILAVQIGLVARWRAWGVEPAAVIGHSLGEVAAIWASGSLSLEEAAVTIYHRARLSGSTEGLGGIAAVGLRPDRAKALIAAAGCRRVELAAINGSEMVTIAGDKAELDAFLGKLQHDDPNLFVRRVRMDYAPHTSLMDPIREELIRELSHLSPGDSTVPMISTVSGAPVEGHLVGAEYWWRNIRQPVLFKQGIEHAVRDGHRVFLELGPHATLAGMVTGILAENGGGVAITSLLRGKPEAESLRTALAQLVANGVDVDWSALHGRSTGFVSLPLYAFEPQRLWIESEGWRERFFQAPSHPLLGWRHSSPEPMWENEIDLRDQPYLADHAVGGSVIFPAAGYVEVLLAAAAEIVGEGPVEIEELHFFEAMVLEKERTEVLRTRYDSGRRRLQIHSRTREGDPDWVLRASAKVGLTQPQRPTAAKDRHLETEKPISGEVFQKKQVELGFEYGPAFQNIKRIWTGVPSSRATIVPAKELQNDLDGYRLHPALLDACFQVSNGTVVRAMEERGVTEHTTYLPVRMQRLRWYRPMGKKRFSVESTVTHYDVVNLCFRYRLLTDRGECIAEIEQLTSQNVGRAGGAVRRSGPQLGFYRESWSEQPLPQVAEGTAKPPAKTWLLLGTDRRLTAPLTRRLRAEGHRVVQVGNEVRLDRKEEVLALLDRLAGEEPALGNVVYLGAAEDQEAAGSADELLTRQLRSTTALMGLIQALNDREQLAPRLWLVTRGAQLLHEQEASPEGRGLAQAPLAAMARTALSELQRVRTTVVDLPPAAGPGDMAQLADELLASSPEFEVALRGQRLVRRVDHLPTSELPPRRMRAGDSEGGVPPFRVAMKGPGVIDDLHLEEMELPLPGDGEVVVEVKTVGLNFRDVMAATGLLPDEAESGLAWKALGLECAGVVHAVGKGVRHVKVGDRVMTAAKGCFVSHLKLPGAIVHRMPRGLDFQEAATISSAFMTAYHALVRLAKLQPGEKVLVHLATGGVGLAAIEICRMIGAEIYATAGSDSKRAYLKKLGVEHVMNSRTLDFSGEVLELTGGRGVDVVLNALAGAAIEGGLKVLAPYGRFLEIGKRDIYADSAISLRLLRKNITFHAIDLAAMGEERPEQSGALFVELAQLLAKRKIHPLPTVVFDADHVADAFRHMAAAKHIGKVVVSFEKPPTAVAKSRELGPKIRSDSAYLITGGLGGFGAEVARWLGERGAGALILMSRSGASTPDAKKTLQRLRRKGVRVFVVKGDAGRLDDVKAAVDTAAGNGFPLRGLVHSAMVLDDGFISQLDAERLGRVMRPKISGAWNLHLATRKLPLDFFVTFSSVAALMGSTGQANYVAANGFLDSFMCWRHALGLPGQSVGWGALGGVGVIERSAGLQRYMESMGLHPIAVADALHGLSEVMCADLPVSTYLRVDWAALARALPAVSDNPRLAGTVAAFASGRAGGGRLRAELMNAGETQRQSMLGQFLRAQVAKVLKVEPAGIAMDQPLAELGLDSLSSFELKNRIESELAVSLPVGRFLQKPTLNGLATAIADALTTTQESDAGDTQLGHAAVALPSNVAFALDLYHRGLRATALIGEFETA
ncbi:MAG TPA: type I polyketide synthase, partial [Kiloniellales bacterium]|nr:type I polyketide synthase [Kiloniellales bacterium]